MPRSSRHRPPASSEYVIVASVAVPSTIAASTTWPRPDARDSLYEQVSMKLMQDAVYLPLWDVNDPFTMAPGVTGLHTTLNGYITFHAAAVG